MFNNEVLLITGGTGSFGNAVLRRFLDSPLREIRIFSRDEKKQDDMRRHCNNSKIKFPDLHGGNLYEDFANKSSILE